MATHDMGDLEAQGRRAYLFWPLFLVRQKRLVEKNMLAAGVHDETIQPSAVHNSSERTLLISVGLPVVDSPDLSLPQRERLSGVRFWFRTGQSFDDDRVYVLDMVRQMGDATVERRELMRVSHDDPDNSLYLKKASQRLNELLQLNPPDLVLAAAMLWSQMHQAVVLDWVRVAASLVEMTDADPSPSISMPPLPAHDVDKGRKKGKVKIRLHNRNILELGK